MSTQRAVAGEWKRVHLDDRLLTFTNGATGEGWQSRKAALDDVSAFLKDYLPRLTPRSAHYEKCPGVGRDVLNTVQKGVEARNALLHRGEPSSITDLDDLDGAVHYCLRLFDFWTGEDWARDYLREAWRYR